MAAPTPATGTRGQIPGVGAANQPRRRNSCNAPRTWRGTKPLYDNQTPIGLSGAGGGATQATGTLTITPTTVLTQQIPGVGSNAQPRRRNPVNAPRSFRGSRPAQLPFVFFNGTGSTGTQATGTLSVAVPLAGSAQSGSSASGAITTTVSTLLTQRIPGIGAKGQPRRRNPVNAPRTFRGSKTAEQAPHATPVALSGVAQTGSSASAIFFVLTQSFVGVAQTGSKATAALTVAQPLQATGKTGSRGTAALTVKQPLAGTAKTGTRGIATISQVAPFNGLALTGTRATATLSVAVSLTGTATSGMRASATIGVAVPLGGKALSASRGTATQTVSITLRGSALAGTKATGAIKVTIPFSAIASTGTRGLASFTTGSTIVQFHGVGQTASTATGRLGKRFVLVLQPGFVAPRQAGVGTVSPRQEDALV